MINRRKFLETAIAAAAAAQARPLFAAETRGIQGANDRIRVGIIGCGNRGNQVATDWMKHKDTVFTAAVRRRQGSPRVDRGATRRRRRATSSTPTRTTAGSSSARTSTRCSSRRRITGTAR